MALSDPIGMARACATANQAARLMGRLEHEISNDLGASEEWHELADRAIDELRAKFPTARSLDAYRQPPASSPAARAGMRSREDAPGRAWIGRVTAAGLLIAVALIASRLLRRVPKHHAIAVLGIGALVGWRLAAAVAFASALLAPLQRVRRSVHIDSRR